MLRADSDTDEARAQPAEDRRPFQNPHGPRDPPSSGGVNSSADLLANRRLYALRDARRKFTAALDLREIGGADSACAKGFRQYVRRCDGILGRKIDPDTGHWRHRVRRISDAHQTRPIPPAEPIDADG